MRLRVYLAVLPWVLFVVVDRWSGPGVRWAAVTALACAVAILLTSIAHRTVSMVEAGPAALFAIVLAMTFVISVHRGTDADRYSRAAVLAVTAAAVALSLTRRPITEWFLQDEVPSRLTRTAAFTAVNRSLTGGLAVLLAAVSVCFMAGAAINDTWGRTIFNWVAPVLVVGAGLRWLSVRWMRYLDVEAQREEVFHVLSAD